MKKIPKKITIVHLSIIFISIFAFICIFFWDWNGWEKIGWIGSFLAGIGIIFVTMQFFIQENTFKKEQIMLIMQLNKELNQYDKLLEGYNYQSGLDGEELEHFLTYIKETIILLNRISLLIDNKVLKSHDIYLFTDHSLVKLIILTINSLVKHHDNIEGIKNNISSYFIIKYRSSLISLYENLKEHDYSLSIVQNEIEQIKLIDKDRNNLSLFVTENE
ncbi:hypothetical protein [Bacillus bingmayongensis]|uniref:hypothetical protein n=1 Tax=Bacillus bingmayongensis TaxID=1150157 RepID=UPI001C8F15E0|nr:hypothetical protein [Bacillus bingmayongensis]MBY0600160.1 hypothetical protein [Bacillus bingmayongensis]